MDLGEDQFSKDKYRRLVSLCPSDERATPLLPEQERHYFRYYLIGEREQDFVIRDRVDLLYEGLSGICQRDLVIKALSGLNELGLAEVTRVFSLVHGSDFEIDERGLDGLIQEYFPADISTNQRIDELRALARGD